MKKLLLFILASLVLTSAVANAILITWVQEKIDTYKKLLEQKAPEAEVSAAKQDAINACYAQYPIGIGLDATMMQENTNARKECFNAIGVTMEESIPGLVKQPKHDVF